jgi:hypothetical protein
MRPRRLVAVLAVAGVLGAGCGGGGEPQTDDVSDDSGCPVGPARVGDLLGYDVSVDERTATPSECRFDPADTAAAEHPGAHVVVAERALAADGESGYDAVLASVEAQIGPTEPLPEGVGGADRGWVAVLGRVVQVGAAVDDRLVQVTVADGALDAAGARGVALRLVAAVLD